MTCLLRCSLLCRYQPMAAVSTWWQLPEAAPGPGQLLDASPGTPDPPAGAGGDSQHLVASCSRSKAWPATRCQLERPGSTGRRRRPWPAPGGATCSSSETWPAARCQPGYAGSTGRRRRPWPAPGGQLQQIQGLASCSMSARTPRIHRPAPTAMASTCGQLQQVHGLASCSM